MPNKQLWKNAKQTSYIPEKWRQGSELRINGWVWGSGSKVWGCPAFNKLSNKSNKKLTYEWPQATNEHNNDAENSTQTWCQAELMQSWRQTNTQMTPTHNTNRAEQTVDIIMKLHTKLTQKWCQGTSWSRRSDFRVRLQDLVAERSGFAVQVQKIGLTTK